MKPLAITLRLIAPLFFVVGGLHLSLGPGAEVLLGAQLPAEALADAALDSQNRFYGVAFTLYGVLLLLCATDVRRYATVLRCVLGVFFTAGLARLVSLALYGFPPPPVIVLGISELLFPPLLAYWLARVEAEGAPPQRRG